MPRDGGCMLFAGGKGDPISDKDRPGMLERLRAGETVELELEAVTYIQRPTPNRNFVRFKPGILASFAKSFEGQPMLRDHMSWQLAARGGTIIASKLEHNDDGSKQIRMRLKLVKPWAVEAALDGTLDRFSIGWSRTGTVECSLCEASLAKCDHWPGDKMADGRVCELVFTAADGTEVSGVNVPAVVGTRIQSISQLEAIDPSLLADILSEDAIPRGDVTMDPKLLALFSILGLSATSTVDDATRAVEKLQEDHEVVVEERDELKATLAANKVAEDTKTATERKAITKTKLAELIKHGKLKPGSKREARLRAESERNFEGFVEQCSELLEDVTRETPVGAPLPALAADPAPAGQPEGKAFLGANPTAAAWLKKAGVSEEQFEKHGAGARELVLASHG